MKVMRLVLSPVQVLVSDTSVLLDLQRGSLLEAGFRLPFRFVVSDLLYKRELEKQLGEELMGLGLVVEELDGDGVSRAQKYQQRVPALSLPDCFGLVLAKTRSWVLLSGDKKLNQLAFDEDVEYHGFLWLLDQMDNHDVAGVRELHDGLTVVSQHPRCRLPKDEVRRRLTSYANRLR